MAFQLKLKAQVKLKVSGETGQIIGRAESIYFGKQYQVEYKRADGAAAEGWFHLGQIETVE